PSPYRGKITAFIHQLANYMSSDDAEKKEEMKEQIKSAAADATSSDQEIYLQNLIDDYLKFSDQDLKQTDANSILNNTLFQNADQINTWLERDSYGNPNDPLAEIAKTMIADYDKAVRLNQLYGKEISGYNESRSEESREGKGDRSGEL